MISVLINVYPYNLTAGMGGLNLSLEVGDKSMSLCQVLTGKGTVEEALARLVYMHFNAWKNDDLEGLFSNIETQMGRFFNAPLVMKEKAYVKSKGYLNELASEFEVNYTLIIKMLSRRKERVMGEMVNNIYKLDEKLDRFLKEDSKSVAYSEKKAVMIKHILSGGDELESLEDFFQYKCDFSLS